MDCVIDRGFKQGRKSFGILSPLGGKLPLRVSRGEYRYFPPGGEPGGNTFSPGFSGGIHSPAGPPGGKLSPLYPPLAPKIPLNKRHYIYI